MIRVIANCVAHGASSNDCKVQSIQICATNQEYFVAYRLSLLPEAEQTAFWRKNCHNFKFTIVLKILPFWQSSCHKLSTRPSFQPAVVAYHQCVTEPILIICMCFLLCLSLRKSLALHLADYTTHQEHGLYSA